MEMLKKPCDRNYSLTQNIPFKQNWTNLSKESWDLIVLKALISSFDIAKGQNIVTGNNFIILSH